MPSISPGPRRWFCPRCRWHGRAQGARPVGQVGACMWLAGCPGSSCIGALCDGQLSQQPHAAGRQHRAACRAAVDCPLKMQNTLWVCLFVAHAGRPASIKSSVSVAQLGCTATSDCTVFVTVLQVGQHQGLLGRLAQGPRPRRGAAPSGQAQVPPTAGRSGSAALFDGCARLLLVPGAAKLGCHLQLGGQEAVCCLVQARCVS